ncbi:hypothetical protein ES703_100824 [subsurface metagenome]
MTGPGSDHRYNRATGIVYVYNTLAGWTAAATVGAFTQHRHFFMTLKLVADFTTGLYARLLFSNVEYPIPAIPLYTIGSGVSPRVEFHIGLLNNNGAGGDVWYDNFIASQNEP